MTIFARRSSRPKRESPSGEAALINNQRQKELQDARIVQAGESIRAAEAQITAADAGVEAANSTIANARSAIEREQGGRRADASSSAAGRKL